MQSGFRCLKKYWLEDISVVYSFLMQSYKSKSCFLFPFSSFSDSSRNSSKSSSARQQKKKKYWSRFSLTQPQRKDSEKNFFFIFPPFQFLFCVVVHTFYHYIFLQPFLSLVITGLFCLFFSLLRRDCFWAKNVEHFLRAGFQAKKETLGNVPISNISNFYIVIFLSSTLSHFFCLLEHENFFAQNV